MTPFKKTSCVLCAQNCGLEVQTENNRIVKVRPDKENPRSRGYVCRKGMNITNHQHHDDRLTHPLKKTPEGFVRISWEQAFSEIGEKLKSIIDRHGPRSFAYMGGGGQGCHFEASFGMNLMKNLGSKYNYNALAQELTGYFWACGRMTGRQNKFSVPDEEHSDMILGIGWNGMVSHQIPRAPLVLKEFANNPDKLLAIIDPRKSETASLANIHIPVRPGTDALLARAMIAVIIREGWENREYIEKHIEGFETIRPFFSDFEIQKALAVCEVDETEVRKLCRELSTRSWCMHFDLGVYMNRHSTLTTYLYMILAAICGRLCVKGGNVIPGTLVPLGSHTDERKPDSWKTVTTGIPAINGAFPPNVMPEEIMSEHPERLRAVLVSASNPLRSYADTTAYENAFKKLDLLVTIELAMTETAEMSDYVLPSRSGYESWDATFFPLTYPEVFFQMRHPVVIPEAETREAGEIMTGIAQAMGLIPDIPDYLTKAAKKGRMRYAAALFSFVSKNKGAFKVLPHIISMTLGREMNSGNRAALWGLLLAAPASVISNAKRAGLPVSGHRDVSSLAGRLFAAFSGLVRYRSLAPLALVTPRIGWAEAMYQTILDHPEGLWIGKADFENNFKEIRTDDAKIHVFIPEMEQWLREINPEAEAEALSPDPAFPLVLNAGRHTPENANTLMRKPDWNAGRRACTLAMNPEDASLLCLKDGEQVKITTEASFAHIELEISEAVRTGQVLIPHGFGLKYKGETYGVNVNRLTRNTHRDRIAATPFHRYVPCRVEKLQG